MTLNFPSSPSDQDTYSGYVYDAAKGVWKKIAETTDNVSEGSTNLYFTDSRARSAISAEAEGPVTYSSATGILDVSTGDGLQVTGNQIKVDIGTGLEFSSNALRVDLDTVAAKSYVDAAVSGLSWKPAVNLLATSNVPLTGNTATVVIDGHAALDSADDGSYRLLLTGQSVDSENGIYVYNDNGSTYTLSRPADADTFGELDSASVLVKEGVLYGSTSWVQVNHYLTDFTDQEWDQFAGPGSYTAGSGLALDGTEFSVDLAALDSDDIQEGDTNLYFTDARAIAAVGENVALNALSDVNTSGVVDGDALVFDNSTTSWIPGSVAIDAINDIADVNITAPADGEFLAYDNSTSSWVNLGNNSVADFYSSTTPPVSPSAGDAWFNTETGRAYVYHDSFWVELIEAGPVGAQGTAAEPTLDISEITASYTLTDGDAGKLIEANSATTITITIPLDSSVAFPVGSQFNVLMSGAGSVTFSPASGVTLNYYGPSSTIANQWSMATLVKRGTNSWLLVGDLSA